MPPRCLRGGVFSSVEQLLQHIDKTGHRISCPCGRVFKGKQGLQDHQRDTECGAASVAARSTAAASSSVQPARQTQLTNGSSGRSFQNKHDLHDHRYRTGHSAALTKIDINRTAEPIGLNVCPLCNRKLANADGVRAHVASKHPSCPACHEHFSTADQRDHHQRVRGHCYCREHEALFGSIQTHASHRRELNHNISYDCVDCERSFASETALEDHLQSRDHSAVLQAVLDCDAAAERAAVAEEENLRCEECQRSFKTLRGLRQHRNSLKHKPLSELQCPLSDKCDQVFTSPSAFVFHLESGKCRSGMDRIKLNAIVHVHDNGHHITYQQNVASVMARTSAAGSLPSSSELRAGLDLLSNSSLGSTMITSSSVDSIVEVDFIAPQPVEDDDSMDDTESVASSDEHGIPVYTPSVSSRRSSVGGIDLLSNVASSWSHFHAQSTNTSTNDVDSSLLEYDSIQKNWPCRVPSCGKSFKKKHSLSSHLTSPAHAPELFHCPTGISLPCFINTTKTFKTLSGFAQHIESGACAGGGNEALKLIARLFETGILSATGTHVKLLTAATRGLE